MTIDETSPNYGGLKAVVITPTIGRVHLTRCAQSIQEQTHPSVEHIVVADGPCRHDDTLKYLSSVNGRRPLHVQLLPYETGLGRYNGYRICAAFSLLNNADYVFFLDDDNWFEPNHIASCIATMQKYSVRWSYSLRQICRPNEEPLIEDNCDSLGHWRRADSYRGPADKLEPRFIEFYSSYPFLIDTSCFGLERTLLTEFAPYLLDGDCFFTSKLIQSEPGACTGLRTLNYRIKPGDEPRMSDYFGRGNRASLERYGNELPWMREQAVSPLVLQRTSLEVPAVVKCEFRPEKITPRGKQTGIRQHPDRKPLNGR